MGLQITDGEVSAIRLFRTVRGKAPEPVKSQFEKYVARSDWAGLLQWSQPILGQLKLPPITVTDLAEVAPLNDGRQDVYLFFHGIEVPEAAAFKERINRLRDWGAWESIAQLATSNPKIPFHFTGSDVKLVLDPTGKIRELTPGQAQAKGFLSTVATDPKLVALKEQIAKLLEWGGWKSVAQIVQQNDKIPFHFNGDDVRAVVDPEGKVLARDPEQIKRMMDVWSFYAGLQTASAGNPDVAKFFQNIRDRVEHGRWKSIADLVNNNKNIPFKGFDVATLKAVLDPQGRYGQDDSCDPPGSPPPPGWTKPITWTIGAGMAAYNWTTGAATDAWSWTAGAADDAIDWTAGAGTDAWNWTAGAAGDVANWTTGAAGDVASWTTGAAGDVASWTTGAAGDVASWTTGAAGDVASWTTNAASDVGQWASQAASEVETVVNPSKW